MVRQLSISSETRSIDYSKPLSRDKRDHHSLYRAVAFILLITTLMGFSIYRLVQLQLIDGKQNRLRAEENRIRLLPIPSNRGLILDRHDQPLAANHQTRAVYLWPKEQTKAQWQKTAAQLSEVLDIPTEQIIAKLERVDYESAAPVRLTQSVTPEAFIWIGENALKLPGVKIHSDSNRYYPHGDVAAHVIGYIGEATLEDLKANPEYPMGMIVGKLGLEAGANDQLSGVWGARLIEVNAQNQEIRMLGEQAPVGGTTIKLTLDLAIQKAAEEGIGYRRGSAVALNVKTGEVLAMASSPRFDPNIFTKPISSEQWQLLQGEDNPFLNRTMQGYPPGSTFKIISSAAGMGSGKYTPGSVIATSDAITVGGITFHEHSGGYGVIGFRDALAFSSNTFFYNLGMDVGPEEIAKWAERFGIGTTDLKLLKLTEGSSGFVPTPDNKEKIFGEPWYLGDTITMAIGQGAVLTTPLELAVMVSTAANGGYRVKPHLLASMTNTPETKPVPTGLTPEAINTIKEGLVAVVEYGTGQGMKDGLPLTGGKTGTSEVLGQRSHSLFVGFGPAANPEIAIAVVIENGGYGSVSAAPVAKQMFQTYFANKNKK
ncbi:penicillin-binding protein 2 [Limnoraphis robusta Tam1]|uniref:Penicillin-binding protein 2 n=1 Tax=Limnoraphis robusta CCNP1315 TaxID=3110306 RepID=A0ABU5U075_9CYAN|nr:penicillin-binding protein 2 [Limnoraphis robusta]MEA5520591.1 penicillin-binding protein 2 [Limnoraphis robusta CCNP1315]MEA5538038.1 penicillin-binding protein 2 [Limnoraphis robusta Tam1]MEA5548580.1 penicillin-binding protein 2 [Limnoraphis robusta CCNP1324]